MFKVSILGSAMTWSKLIFDSAVQYMTLQSGPKARVRDCHTSVWTLDSFLKRKRKFNVLFTFHFKTVCCCVNRQRKGG